MVLNIIAKAYTGLAGALTRVVYRVEKAFVNTASRFSKLLNESKVFEFYLDDKISEKEKQILTYQADRLKNKESSVLEIKKFIGHILKDVKEQHHGDYQECHKFYTDAIDVSSRLLNADSNLLRFEALSGESGCRDKALPILQKTWQIIGGSEMFLKSHIKNVDDLYSYNPIFLTSNHATQAYYDICMNGGIAYSEAIQVVNSARSFLDTEFKEYEANTLHKCPIMLRLYIIREVKEEVEYLSHKAYDYLSYFNPMDYLVEEHHSTVDKHNVEQVQQPIRLMH